MKKRIFVIFHLRSPLLHVQLSVGRGGAEIHMNLTTELHDFVKATAAPAAAAAIADE